MNRPLNSEKFEFNHIENILLTHRKGAAKGGLRRLAKASKFGCNRLLTARRSVVLWLSKYQTSRYHPPDNIKLSRVHLSPTELCFKQALRS